MLRTIEQGVWMTHGPWSPLVLPPLHHSFSMGALKRVALLAAPLFGKLLLLSFIISGSRKNTKKTFLITV